MDLVNLPDIVGVDGHPDNAYADRRGYLHEGIVVHTMAGTLAGCDSWFANPAAQAGTHFGVGRGGEVHQYFDLKQGPFAHGRIEPGFTAKLVADNGTDVNPNWYLIGIEHDDRREGLPPTETQLEASARLAAVLFSDHILPNAAVTGAAVDHDHILRHANISPESRPFCPGWSQELLNRYIRRVQELVAGPGAAATVYAVRAGDTLAIIAKRFGITVAQLRAANPAVAGTTRIVPGQRLTIPSGAQTYTVQPGDTFGHIAATFGLSVERLHAANPQVDDPDLIFPGQQLLIPVAA